jgi:hypothetical protein
MPITDVSGDPTLTRAQVLAIGTNARGRQETDPLASLLHQRYPTAFSAYQRRARKGLAPGGSIFIWRETTPGLLFMTCRQSPVGATRLRYVENIALTLARDYRREGLTSLAIAPLGRPEEWPEIQSVLQRWLDKSALPVVLYTAYQPGVQAEEGL